MEDLAYFSYQEDQVPENVDHDDIKTLSQDSDDVTMKDSSAVSPVLDQKSIELLKLLSKITGIESDADDETFIHQVYRHLYENTCEGASFAACVILSLVPISDPRKQELISLYVDYPFSPSIRQVNPVTQHARFKAFQKLLFQDFGNRDFSLSNVSAAQTRTALGNLLNAYSVVQLTDLCNKANIEIDFIPKGSLRKDLLVAAVAETFKRRELFSSLIEKWILHVNETNIFHDFSGKIPLFTNEKYGSVQDYIYRAYCGYACAGFNKLAAYFKNIVRELRPRFEGSMDESSTRTRFIGKSINALPIIKIVLSSVGGPRVSDLKPVQVIVDVTYNVTPLTREGRKQWDSIKVNDNIYIGSLFSQPSVAGNKAGISQEYFTDRAGFKYIRVGRVVGLVGDEGKEMGFFNEYGSITQSISETEQDVPSEKSFMSRGLFTNTRTLRILLDSSQYVKDCMSRPGATFQTKSSQMSEFYDIFNVIIKCSPKVSPVNPGLEYLKDDLISIESKPVTWIQKSLMGISSKPKSQDQTLFMSDTFVDSSHLFDTLGIQAEFDFVRLVQPKKPSKKRQRQEEQVEESRNVVQVSSEQQVMLGPLVPPKKTSRNQCKYTKDQVEAIRSAMAPGWTLIQGPPQSGKSLVLGQVMSNLLLDGKKMLIICSNEQSMYSTLSFFSNVHPYYESFVTCLSTVESHWTPLGRVSSIKQKKAYYLSLVDALAKSIGIDATYSLSAESACYFYRHYLKYDLDQITLETRWEDFKYKAFFKEEFGVGDDGNALELRNSLVEMFDLLEKWSIFDIIQKRHQHTKRYFYSLVQVFVTTAQQLPFFMDEISNVTSLDSIICDDSTCIAQHESYFGISLYPERIILTASVYDQSVSLFRKISVLDSCKLFTFTDSFTVRSSFISFLDKFSEKSFRALQSSDIANPGFLNDFEFINVEGSIESVDGSIDVIVAENDKNTGTSTTFLANKAEAQFTLALYKYMRLLGYNSDEICICTPVDSQRHLIQSLIGSECFNEPVYGSIQVELLNQVNWTPAYMLVSLCETNEPSIAVPRMFTATKGVYVLGNWKVNAKAWAEFKEIKSQHLVLLPEESFGDFEQGKVRKSTQATRKNAPKGSKTIKNLQDLIQIVQELHETLYKF